MLSSNQINSWGFFTATSGILPNVNDSDVNVAYAGSANTETSWVEVIPNLAQDAWLLALSLAGGGTSGASPQVLIDVGVDPAGGTSYSAVISNICSGLRQGSSTKELKIFPLFLTAGSAIAVRHQASSTSACSADFSIYGQPSRPEICMKGQFCETIGTVTNSSGVAVTPGTGAEGSWTEIGTTSKDLWWWQLSCQPDDTSTSAVFTSFDLAFGDATNKHIIIEDQMYVYSTTEQGAEIAFVKSNYYCPVPSGTSMYVRGHCSGTPDSGWNVLIHGIGG